MKIVSIIVLLLFMFLVGNLHAANINLPYSNNFSSESDDINHWGHLDIYKNFDDWFEVGYRATLTPPSEITVSLNSNLAYCYGGTKSVKNDWYINEDRSKYGLWFTGVNAIYIRQYIYFKGPFDHGQQPKYLQFGMHTGGVFNWQVVFNFYADPIYGPSYTGTNSCAYARMAYNGGPSDWGGVQTSLPSGGIADDTWYFIEVYIKLNTPGSSDGEIKIWLERADTAVSFGSPTGSATGLNIQGNNNWPINYITFGGWFSNGGNAPDPSPITWYLGSIGVSEEWIPPISGGTLNGVTMQGVNLR